MARFMESGKEIGQDVASARCAQLLQDQTQSVSIVEQIDILQAMDLIALRSQWRKLKGSDPPHLSRDLMLRSLAYELQAKAFGSLLAGTIKRLGALNEEAGDGGAISSPSRPSLSPGARLVREWHGRTHSVEVLQEGFLFEGKIYRSLSKIALQITGSHWSGPRFFGLIKKRR